MRTGEEQVEILAQAAFGWGGSALIQSSQEDVLAGRLSVSGTDSFGNAYAARPTVAEWQAAIQAANVELPRMR